MSSSSRAFEDISQPQKYLPAGRFVELGYKKIQTQQLNALNCIQSAGNIIYVSQGSRLTSEDGDTVAKFPESILEFSVTSRAWMARCCSAVYYGTTASHYYSHNMTDCRGISIIAETDEYWASSNNHVILVDPFVGTNVFQIHTKEDLVLVSSSKHPRVALAAGERMYWVDGRSNTITHFRGRAEIASWEMNMQAWSALTIRDNLILAASSRQKAILLFDSRTDRSPLAEWAVSTRVTSLVWARTQFAALTSEYVVTADCDTIHPNLSVLDTGEILYGCFFKSDDSLQLLYHGRISSVKFSSCE